MAAIVYSGKCSIAAKKSRFMINSTVNQPIKTTPCKTKNCGYNLYLNIIIKAVTKLSNPLARIRIIPGIK